MRSKEELIHLIKEQISKREFHFFLSIEEYDFLDKIWFNDGLSLFLNTNKIYYLALLSKMEWKSNPSKYKVLLLDYELIQHII